MNATSAAEAPQAAAKPDPSLVEQLRDDAQGSVSLAREAATRSLGFVQSGRNGDLLPDSSASAGIKADAFVDEYGVLFGATQGTLVRESVKADGIGGRTVTYVQEYKGVPVFGAMLRAHVDRQGDLTAVNGTAVPKLDLSVDPGLSAAAIGKRAVAYVKSEPPSHDGKDADTTGIKAAGAELIVYREGLVRGETGDSHLAYAVEVTNRANIRDMVFMRASNGKVLNRYSLVHDALERKVYEQAYNPASLVWQEGDAFPGTLTPDQQNIVEGSGESYWFFMNSFGRDSYDGAGHVMETVNNDPRISCPNANWNGTTTNYCNGVTSDDVVAHEWGHAYTEYTHNLIYQWQPGALNESYSDIWGETVDLINGRQDGANDAVKRADNACSTHTNPRPVLVINSPPEIARVCQAAPASFGPPITDPGTTGDVVLGLDPADVAGPSTTDACTALTNPAEVAGKIALVDRGSCAFTIKVKNAQNAGAIAVVVGQNHPFAPSSMSGADPTITIPSLMISQANRFAISDQLAAGDTVNVTLRPDPAVREDSYRWLIGEDSTAFGGAIRDMWTPTCINDPGKVSDAEYHCSPDDGGGVHSNSGVPNHGYALLVDGGTYNGVTVPSLGLTKAAHIYWRAQDVYQVPTTDFADHADALEASCADLTDMTVDGLSTAGSPEDTNAPPPLEDETIEAVDCAAVGAMISAVELRREPTQCNFQPLLQPGNPKVCGAKQSRNTFWYDDFESGFDNWAVSSEWVFEDQPYDWSVDSSLPGNRGGSAAYGPDPDAGNCSLGAGDISGVMHMDSEPILVDGANSKSARLTFRHYVATEAGWDGGNVKVSVNGGGYEVVPVEAYIFNPPNAIINTAAAGNTNPLAGEPGFTGTDGGEVGGTWGNSQIDLSMIGVTSGDVVELRFDMGMDGCSGVDGWYVDNVQLSTCKAKTKTDGMQKPKPVAFGRSPRVLVDVDSVGGFGPATGDVVARDHGRVLARGVLENGRATLWLPEMRAGSRDVRVRYTGDGFHAPSSDKVSVRVAKGDTSTRLDVQPSPVAQGRRVFADVDVNGAGFTPGGRVVLMKGRQVVAAGALDDGEKRFILDADWKPGRYLLEAKYLGSANAKSSMDADYLRITKK